MPESPLERAASRASQSAFFLGSALARYSDTEQLHDPELASRLCCEVEVLPKLRLCRRPDTRSPQFAADVRRIAHHFGIDPVQLAELLRQVDALDALEATDTENTSLLAAARDLEEPEHQ